ncbi:MAG: ABC transporter ATP-binding protein [Acidobacteriota bacterium]|nr:ABC transporter ATP-binding protein [Acidobacteriota bacterium]
MTTSGQSIFTYIRPYGKRLVLALFFMTLVAAFTAMFALIIQPLMDELFIQGAGGTAAMVEKGLRVRNWIQDLFQVDRQGMTLLLPQLLFISFLGQAVFQFFSLYYTKTLGLKVVRNIRNDLYRNLMYQSIDFLSKSRTGDLVSRLTNDIEKIKFAVSETLAVYVRESLTLVALLFVIFFHDWYLSLISLLILPVAAFFLAIFGRRVKKRGIQSHEAVAQLSNAFTETMTGNKIVKAYNMEEEEIRRFSGLNHDHYHINSRIALVYSMASPVMHTIGGLVAAIIFTLGMRRIAQGVMSPGQFSSFLAALFLMYNPIKRLSQANNDYQQGKAGYERVQEIMNTDSVTREPPGARSLDHVAGKIEFRDVCFAYSPDTPVIRNVSFSVQPNEVVALVGASGSGKTTLMNLLMRFYEPDSGQILLDDINTAWITRESLRRHIGLVTQDVFLFNDTIANNIAYGSGEPRIKEIREAARIARAADFIEKLPRNYASRVGERGVFLSTGQRQRILIARAIYRQPRIMVFDEATSALDTESEKAIQEAMLDVMEGRTTFVIAHRLSTIIEADMILVIENGCIRESGNHRDLLKRRGLYYSLYNLQFPEMDIIM